MGLQDSVENRYRNFAGREHIKTYAQFFTPIPVATVMAAYLLDNPKCRTILDPASGLMGLSRAVDDVLTLINAGKSQDLVTLIASQVEAHKANQLQAPALRASATRATNASAQASFFTASKSDVPAATKLPGDAIISSTLLERMEHNHSVDSSELTDQDSVLTALIKSQQGQEFRFRSYYSRLNFTKNRSNSREISVALKRLSSDERSRMITAPNSYPEYLNTQDSWLTPACLLPELTMPKNASKDTGNYSLSPRYQHKYADANLSLKLAYQPLSVTASQEPSCELNLSDLELYGYTTSHGFNFSPEHPDHSTIISELLERDDAGDDQLTDDDPNSESFTRKTATINLSNYELDPLIFSYAKENVQDYPFGFVNNRLKCCDYLTDNTTERFDGILCNPPYMSYKDFTLINPQANPEIPQNLSRRANIYSLFLLQSLKQLNAKGRCAYLIPYEFLNSSFGVKFKSALLEEGSLHSIIIFKIPLFDNVVTTTGLFLFDKSKQQKEIEFITINSLDELPALAVHLCPNLLGALPQPKLHLEPKHDVKTERAKASNAQKAALPPHKVTAPQRSQQSDILAALTKTPALLDSFSVAQLQQSGIVTALDANKLNKLQGGHKLMQRLTMHRLEGITPGSYDLELCGQVIPYASLDVDRKWHVYYQGKEQSQAPQEPKAEDSKAEVPADKKRRAPHPLFKRAMCLSEFIRVKRGIATGANEFFMFNQEEIREHELNPRYFIPVLPRANMTQYPILTLDDFVSLAASNQRVFLLSAPVTFDDPKLSAYLKLGEEAGVHKRFLTSHRFPWYTMERRELAPILFTVFNRGPFTVMRNDARIYNLTAFHSIFVKHPELTDIIFAYLLTPFAADIIRANRREYGRGLEKLEPLDIMESQCVNFYDLTVTQINDIRDLMAQYEIIVGKARQEQAPLLPNSLYQRALEHVMQRISSIFLALHN